jgi:hypothetical protein
MRTASDLLRAPVSFISVSTKPFSTDTVVFISQV